MPPGPICPRCSRGAQPGGQLTTTTEVENFPGYPDGATGPEIMEQFKRQASRFGADFRWGEATDADLSSRPFTITIDNSKIIKAETLIISTGRSARYLGLEDEKNTQEAVSPPAQPAMVFSFAARMWPL